MLNLWFRWLVCFRPSSERERGHLPLAERPVPVWCVGQGALPRMAHLLVWPHWEVLNLTASRRSGRGCGIAVSSDRGSRPGGEMDSRRAALALKPSRPLLRTDRLHWECRCCVRTGAPLMELSTGRRTAIVHAALTRVSPGYGGLSEPQLGYSSLPARPSRSGGPCCAVGGRWCGRVGPGWVCS